MCKDKNYAYVSTEDLYLESGTANDRLAVPLLTGEPS